MRPPDVDAMSSAAIKDAANPPKINSTFNLLSPLPFGASKSRVNAWSPVRFKGVSHDEVFTNPVTPPVTNGTSFSTSRFTLKSVPWRVTKPRPPPGEGETPTFVPLAVVAPLKSSFKKGASPSKKSTNCKSVSKEKSPSPPKVFIKSKSPKKEVESGFQPSKQKSRKSSPRISIENDKDLKTKKSFFQSSSKNSTKSSNFSVAGIVSEKINDKNNLSKTSHKSIRNTEPTSVVPKPYKNTVQSTASNSPIVTGELNSTNGSGDNSKAGKVVDINSRNNVKKVSACEDKNLKTDDAQQSAGKQHIGGSEEKASEKRKNVLKEKNTFSPYKIVCQNKSKTPLISPKTVLNPTLNLCKKPSELHADLDPPLSTKSLNSNGISQSKDTSTGSQSEGPPNVPLKMDAWFKEVQRSSSAGKEKPVWTREKTSPLHSRFQKTKSFYDEMAAKQQRPNSCHLRKDSLKTSEDERQSSQFDEKKTKSENVEVQDSKEHISLSEKNEKQFTPTKVSNQKGLQHDFKIKSLVKSSTSFPESVSQTVKASQLGHKSHLQHRPDLKRSDACGQFQNAVDQGMSKKDATKEPEILIDNKISKVQPKLSRSLSQVKVPEKAAPSEPCTVLNEVKEGICNPCLDVPAKVSTRVSSSTSSERPKDSDLKNVAVKTIVKTLQASLSQSQVDLSRSVSPVPSNCVTTNVTLYVSPRSKGNISKSPYECMAGSFEGCIENTVESAITVAAFSTSDSSDSSSSVHCGRENRVEGGGVMEDGRILTPHPSYIQPLSSLTTDSWKSQSLPGFYNRPISPAPQSFKDAFTSSYSPFSKRKDPVLMNSSPAQHTFNTTNLSNTEKLHTNGHVEEKKSRSFLGGLFRRKKKEESFSGSSSSDSDGFKKSGTFFGKKVKKIEQRFPPNTFVNPNQGQLTMPPNKNGPVNNTTLQKGSDYIASAGKGNVIKVSPTGSLGRQYNASNDTQPLGIPYIPSQGILGRKGVSVSHDSLAPSAASWNSESAYGSINSSMRSSRLGRSSSTDTLTKKGRREALKSRVEKLREKHKGGSSSEDDVASLSSQFGSENSLNKSISSTRSRSSRTERYLRRKAQELETLKVETEKDKRNREVVQARILEIQKSQKLREAKKHGINGDDNENDKPKWSAKLVYQVSNQIDHEPFVIRNLAESPSCSRAAQRHMNVQNSPSLDPYYKNKFQIPPFSNSGIQSQRSISYESNINHASNMHLNYMTKASFVNSGGFLPPAPPPRDRSRLLSPCEPSRPSSYSFENINQDPLHAPHNTNGVPVPFRNSFQRESSPSMNRPVPPMSPNLSNIAQQLPPTGQCRRSMSEKHLTPPRENVASEFAYITRNAPPKVYIPPITQFNSFTDCNRPSNQQQQYSEVAYLSPSNLKPLNEKNSQYSRGIPATNVPPSPSSDYSSYVSDNSVRTSQMQPMSLPPEMVTHSHLSVKSVDPSNSISSKNCINNVKPDTALNSLNCGQSDSSNLVSLKQVEKVGQVDSDSSQSSNKGITYKVCNRPLSMVAEKSESANGEKDSSPVNAKLKPEPPKRGSSSLTKKNRELLLKHLELIKELEKDESFIGRQKKFEEVFKKEKERLQRTKCTNFEEALHELEEIYKSLNLNSEDIMEGAERIEEQNERRIQGIENLSCKLSEDRTDGRSPMKRSSTPDKTKDDLHYRRVQLSNRNQPDVKKAVQITGSYMLVSPVHVPPAPHVLEIPKDHSSSKEPDITFDDVTFRSTQRANSIKIIDPQPPFGIPLDPIKQTSHIDYLHTPSQLQTNDDLVTKEEPDIVSDDMAFRNLRKDNKSASNKSLNVSELDEILSEANESPHINRRMLRSASADRIISGYPSASQLQATKKVDNQTPRKVKQQQRARRGGKFIDTFKEALTDSESSSALNWKRNPSWVERANLSDNKWGNLSTSTETLTDLSSVKAVSQPDIRHAIIRESRASSGGPFDSFSILEPEFSNEEPPPHLVRINSFHNISPSPRMVSAKPYRPLDAMYNTKPKPFYITNLPRNEAQLTQSPVDIAKLDDLISTLSSLESSDAICDTIVNDKETPAKLVSKSALYTSSAPQYVANKCHSKEGNQFINKANVLKSTSFPNGNSSKYSHLDISVTSKQLPGPVTPEKVIILSDAPTQDLFSPAYEASKRTNKVESMLVTSQEVEDRDVRAKSVPPPPKQNSSHVDLPIKILIHKSPSNLDLPKPVPYSRSASCLPVSTTDSYQSTAPITNASLSSSYLSMASSTGEKYSSANSEENISPLAEDHLSVSSAKCLQSPCSDTLLSISNEPSKSHAEEDDLWVTPPSSTAGSSKSLDSEEGEDNFPLAASPGEEGRRCLASNTEDTTTEEPLWYHWGIALIYVLVCLLHFSGLEIITAFGLILAMASVLITFAN